jgi:RNA polymerase-binding transcription factor DksA
VEDIMNTSPNLHSTLTARLDDLRKRLVRIETELDVPGNPDWEDRATEREGDEVLEAMGQSGIEEMRMIEAALERLDNGTYGTCAKCGNAIGEKRLAALPITPFCATCAP